MAYTTTYGQLITQAIADIKSNSWNVDTNYDNNLPAAYKSGWTQTNKNNALTCVASIKSGAVSKVAGSTVESEFNSYMSSVGMSSRSSEVITLNGLLQFLHYLTCFCMTRVYHWTSQYANPVCIYISGSKTYVTGPTNGSNTEIITAIDENNLNQVLGSIINTKTNLGCTQYNRTLTWTGT